MSISRFFKKFVDSEMYGDEMVATQVNLYKKKAEREPEKEPHMILLEMWEWRMKLQPSTRKRIDSDVAFKAELNEVIRQFACMPFPDNAKAFGHLLVAMERPDVVKQYPRFRDDYEELLEQVMYLDPFMLQSIYAEYNPTMANS